MPGPVAILFERFGPYHVERIAAAQALFPVVGIEFGAETSAYAWDKVETVQRFERHAVVPRGLPEHVSTPRFGRALLRLLDQIRPGAIAVPGWADRGCLITIAWARVHRVPVIMMSESQREDFVRVRWREAVKSAVVRACDAGLVGGVRHFEYMHELGMSRERIFTGYDVVDNEHFARGAAAARADHALRARLDLPARYFLASNRFLPKKNLDGLLRAFARYVRSTAQPVSLVMLGDGPLKPQLQTLCGSLGLDRHVHFAGFRQYDELPSYYGLAEAFVHTSSTEQWGLVVNEAMAAGLPVLVSRACGCSPELVREGENGHTFEHKDEALLARLLAQLADDAGLRSRMATRSAELIAGLSPAAFASGLGRACEAARSRV